MNAELILPRTADVGSLVSSGDANQLASAQVHWYAVYTCANHEKHVAEQFSSRGIEHFLPLYESVRQWKDRKVRLQRPLFPGYVFVHMFLQGRLPILQVPGVVRVVGFEGHAAPLAEEEVARVRAFLEQGFCAEPYRYLRVGKRARVVRGPLQGMEGTLVRRKNGHRFVISFDLIQRAMAVEVSALDLEPAAPRTARTTLRAEHV